MGAYINKDLKELIITLASVIGFGDVLVKTGRLHQEDEDAAKLMMGAATTISQHLLQGRDAERVVRCKDCRLRGREECAMFYRCECGEQHTWETDNDFCSYGERI